MNLCITRTPTPVCPPRIIVHRRRSESTSPAIIIHRAPLVKRFSTVVDIDVPAAKRMQVIKDGDVVIDYRDVSIEGYLSTWEAVTPTDRDGEYVEGPGVFRDTIPQFMKNPVLLTDHRNSVSNLAGKFVEMKEDKTGLFFKALLSNAPGMIDVRFQVAEKFLRTVSMGGLLTYRENGRGIFKVDLWEGSLTPVPSNPDARFSLRALEENN